MPLKIKLPTPVATAEIASISLAEEIAKSASAQTETFHAHEATDEAEKNKSGFPLPPLPHQGRSHADNPSNAAPKHLLATNTKFPSDGVENHDSHTQEFECLQPNQQTAEFEFTNNNIAVHFNSPSPHWRQHHQQQQQVAGDSSSLKTSLRADYKDFLPPPIHVPKRSDRVSGTAAKNNGSEVGTPTNDHSSPPGLETNNLNHNNQQQEQNLLLLPLPHEGMEKTLDGEKECEMLENSQTIVAANSDRIELQEKGIDAVPLYAYSTMHQQKSWNEMIGLFTRFIEENGHSNVEMENVKMSVDGSNESSSDCQDEILLILCSWVRELRYIRHADDGGNEKSMKRSAKQTEKQQQQRCDSENLTPERISRLDEMSFPWKNNQTQWQTWLDDLLHYRVKNNGDCNVPLKFPEYPALGKFVNRQRVEYKKMKQGKPSTMSSAKIKDLDRVSFVWSVREGGRVSWDDRFAELVEYQREKGHFRVPKKYPANPPLGYWVNEQRFQYQRYINGKSSTMNKKRQESMDSINFEWSVRKGPHEFSQWITLLQEYKIQWGNCNVPLKYKQDPSLGAFVNNARTHYRKFQRGMTSNMTQEKMYVIEIQMLCSVWFFFKLMALSLFLYSLFSDRLEEIGFVWNVREGRTPWHQRFEELKEFKEKHG